MSGSVISANLTPEDNCVSIDTGESSFDPVSGKSLGSGRTLSPFPVQSSSLGSEHHAERSLSWSGHRGDREREAVKK